MIEKNLILIGFISGIFLGIVIQWYNDYYLSKWCKLRTDKLRTEVKMLRVKLRRWELTR